MVPTIMEVKVCFAFDQDDILSTVHLYVRFAIGAYMCNYTFRHQYSAIINFIKFHVHMAKEGQEQEKAAVSTTHVLYVHV